MISHRNEWISNACALLGTAALAVAFSGYSMPRVEEQQQPEPLGMEISMASVDAAPPAEPPVPEPPKEEPPPPKEPPPPEPPPPDAPPPLPEPDPTPPPPVPEALPEQTPEVVTPPPVVEPPKPAPPKPTPPKPEPPKPPTPPKPQQPPKPRPETVRAAETAPVRSTASASASAAAAFRSCLAAAPYPQSKDARLQKPSGIVGISISGGVVTVTKSSGSQILDQAARSRAGSCAEAAGAATLSGSINYIPR